MQSDAIFAITALKDLSALELHKIYKLRVDVFVHEQRCAYQEIDDIDAQDTTLHVQAWSSDAARELLAVGRIYPATHEGQAVTKFGRFICAPSQRGTGIAQALMLQSLRYCYEQHPALPVYIDAQAGLESYYEQFGFRRVGENFDDEGIAHAPMLLDAAELAVQAARA